MLNKGARLSFGFKTCFVGTVGSEATICDLLATVCSLSAEVSPSRDTGSIYLTHKKHRRHESSQVMYDLLATLCSLSAEVSPSIRGSGKARTQTGSSRTSAPSLSQLLPGKDRPPVKVSRRKSTLSKKICTTCAAARKYAREAITDRGGKANRVREIDTLHTAAARPRRKTRGADKLKCVGQ